MLLPWNNNNSPNKILQLCTLAKALLVAASSSKLLIWVNIGRASLILLILIQKNGLEKKFQFFYATSPPEFHLIEEEKGLQHLIQFENKILSWEVYEVGWEFVIGPEQQQQG